MAREVFSLFLIGVAFSCPLRCEIGGCAACAGVSAKHIRPATCTESGCFRCRHEGRVDPHGTPPSRPHDAPPIPPCQCFCGGALACKVGAGEILSLVVVDTVAPAWSAPLVDAADLATPRIDWRLRPGGENRGRQICCLNGSLLC